MQIGSRRPSDILWIASVLWIAVALGLFSVRKSLELTDLLEVGAVFVGSWVFVFISYRARRKRAVE